MTTNSGNLSRTASNVQLNFVSLPLSPKHPSTSSDGISKHAPSRFRVNRIPFTVRWHEQMSTRTNRGRSSQCSGAAVQRRGGLQPHIPLVSASSALLGYKNFRICAHTKLRLRIGAFDALTVIQMVV